MADYTSKNGLLFTNDMKILVGIDSKSTEFNGTVPYGPEDVWAEAFADTTVSEIVLPESIKELSDCQFENLTSLESVKLPSSLKVLPPYLFSGCTKLSKVAMPVVVTAFPEGLFYGCASLQEIPFRVGIQELPENVCAGCSSIKSVVIPNSVAKIGSRAFADCKGLETVVLPAKIYELADDAFEGCDSIRNIRIDDGNNLFYIKEEDGCLYEKSIDGEDKLRLKVNKAVHKSVEFFEDQLKENSAVFIADDDELEDDDIFSSEVGAADEELVSMGAAENDIVETVNDDTNVHVAEDSKMAENNVDDMLADIMGEEKARVEAGSGVGIGSQEGAALSEAIDVMEDSAASHGAEISQNELENLFASNESQEPAGRDDVVGAQDSLALDSKTKILVESVGFSKIEICEPEGESPEDSDLFVIAEKIVTSDLGEHSFSQKLVSCVKKIARIHDFKRIIMLYGLPSDNEEFKQFYFHFINKRNVILACEAASPASLSDYGKMICEQSRISLESSELAEQRKRVSIKNDMLIKLVIQDKYE